MRKYFAAIIFIYAIAYAASAQNIDSLKKVLPSLHDTDRIDCLNELSYCYTYVSKKDSAAYYATVAENEAKKLNYIPNAPRFPSGPCGEVLFPLAALLPLHYLGLLFAMPEAIDEPAQFQQIVHAKRRSARGHSPEGILRH